MADLQFGTLAHGRVTTESRDATISRGVQPRTSEHASPGLSVSPPGLSLTHNFAWTLAGNLIYAGCQWLVIVLLAKLGSAEMIGQYALALAVAYPITLLANLQLRTLFVTDHQTKYPFGEMLGLRLVLSAAAVLAILVTCKIAAYGGPATSLALIIGVAQLVDCISENYYGICQRHERLDRIARSQMLRSILSFFALALAMYYTGNLLWGAAGFVLGRLLVLLGYDAGRDTFTLAGTYSDRHGTSFRHPSYWERIRPRWNFRKQLEMVWVAFPLGAASVLVSLNGNMPRYVIERYLGPHELGIYAALNYIPAAGLMIAIALGNAVFARLSKLYFTGDLPGFTRVLIKSATICAGLGIAGLLASAVAGRQVLTLLYRPEYAERSDLLLLLMAVGAVGCLASCLGCAITATSQFRAQVALFLVVTTSSVVACFLLIPRRGLHGAALAALVSMSVQLLGTAFLIYRAMVKAPANRGPAFRSSLNLRSTFNCESSQFTRLR